MNKHSNFIGQEDVKTKFDHIAACEYARRAAWEARAEESATLAAHLDGRLSEDDYCRAMDNTATACKYAISCGVDRSALPIH